LQTRRRSSMFQQRIALSTATSLRSQSASYGSAG
jgi:hypothetical protein